MSDLFPGRAGYRQLAEWGFPQGTPRVTPLAAKAFSVIHITGNSNLPAAEGELAWRINDPANQNSATFFVNRDGAVWQALGDPLHMDPWANGDVRSPDLSNPRIAAVVRDGVNANERTIVAIENVGYEPGYSITGAQEKANAQILAYYHAKAGVPVTRETVVGHYQLNSVTRPNCPAIDKRVLDRIVALATPSEDETVEFRPKAEKWGIAQGAGGWNVYPPTGAPDTTYRAGTARTMLEDGATVDGVWESGAYRLLTNGVWVRRADLTPTVQGGDPVYQKLVTDAYNEKLPSAPAPDCSAEVAAALAPYRDWLAKAPK